MGLTSQGDITLKALGAGDITVSNNIQKAGSGAQTLTLQANENIVFNNSADVGLASGATNTYNVVLNADRDASAGGAIQLNSGTVINSNGGSITLGGGASPLTRPQSARARWLKGETQQCTTGFRRRGHQHSRHRPRRHNERAWRESCERRFGHKHIGQCTVIGTGGAGTAAPRDLSDHGSSIASGTGLITLAGTGSGIGASNIGVELSASSISFDRIGDIQITGTGAAGSNDISVERHQQHRRF